MPIPEMTRGDDKPDLRLQISDLDGTADFSSVTPDAVLIVAEMDGLVKWSHAPDTVTPSADKKSAVLQRAWGPTDTDTAGRCWFYAVVTWGPGEQQTFPCGFIDFLRAPGDA